MLLDRLSQAPENLVVVLSISSITSEHLQQIDSLNQRHGERDPNPTSSGDLGDWRRRIQLNSAVSPRVSQRGTTRALAELQIGGRVQLTNGAGPVIGF
uniref:Uncharacterized protein n=1 Tax=Arundo donax TaxID=35708 RepID=A0A0A9EQ33_ARUDO